MKNARARRRRQGQPPRLHRRRPRRRRRQHRRRHHHRNYDGYAKHQTEIGAGVLDRLERGAGRAGDRRRRRLYRRRQRHHPRRAGRRAGDCPRPPGRQGGLGPAVSRNEGAGWKPDGNQVALRLTRFVPAINDGNKTRHARKPPVSYIGAVTKRFPCGPPRGRPPGQGRVRVMCGIVGILGQTPVAPMLVDALKRLEYRGYDFGRRRHAGRRPSRPLPRRGQAHQPRGPARPRAARRPLRHRPYPLGDPRRADRGERPSARHRPRGARPQRHHREFPRAEDRAGSGRRDVRHRDRHRGHRPPDHPRARRWPLARRGASPRRSSRLRGAFAIAVLFDGEDDLMIGARRGSPLAIGYGHDEMFFGSDAIALAPFTDRITYLEDGDWAVLTRAGAVIHDATGAVVERPIVHDRRLQPARRPRQLPPLHGEGDPRAAGGGRPHARPLSRLRPRPRADAGRLRPSISPPSTACRSPPAARPTTPASSPSTGSSVSPAFPSTSTSPRSSATASSR